VTDRTKASGNY